MLAKHVSPPAGGKPPHAGWWPCTAPAGTTCPSANAASSPCRLACPRRRDCRPHAAAEWLCPCCEPYGARERRTAPRTPPAARASGSARENTAPGTLGTPGAPPPGSPHRRDDASPARRSRARSLRQRTDPERAAPAVAALASVTCSCILAVSIEMLLGSVASARGFPVDATPDGRMAQRPTASSRQEATRKPAGRRRGMQGQASRRGNCRFRLAPTCATLQFDMRAPPVRPPTPRQ